MSQTDDRGHVDAGAPGAGLWSLLRQVIRNVMLEISVAQPATVVSYNPATRRARVTLGFRIVEDRLPERPDAPRDLDNLRVCWLGTGSSDDTAPLPPGSHGIVLFMDRALDQWYSKGGAVDPVDGRAHSEADAVFLPMRMVPDASATATDPTARVIEASAIKLGATATLHPALAEQIHTYMISMITSAGVAPNDGGATFKAALLAYLAANPYTSFSTSKVTAE